MEKNMARNSGRSKLFNPNLDKNLGLAIEREGESVMAKDKYGFLPTSVWDVKKDKDLVKLVADDIGGGSYAKNGRRKKQGEEDLSLFNPSVARRIIAYYSNPGDWVVAPYGSRGVWGIVGALLGRNVHSGDIVPEYIESMRRRFEDFKKTDNYIGTELEVFMSNAQDSVFESNKYDLLVASPPYPLQVEVYKHADNQMTDIKGYDEFFDAYRLCIKDHYRIVKPGGYVVYVTSDIRRDGVFYPFGMDTVRVFQEEGFIYHDIIINKLNSRSVASIGMNEKKGNKIMAKTHEMINVFRKPLE